MGEFIADGWATDVYFMVGTLLLGVGSGFATGVWCANRRGRPLARLVEALSMVAFCTPVYVTGLLLLAFVRRSGSSSSRCCSSCTPTWRRWRTR